MGKWAEKTISLYKFTIATILWWGNELERQIFTTKWQLLLLLQHWDGQMSWKNKLFLKINDNYSYCNNAEMGKRAGKTTSLYNIIQFRVTVTTLKWENELKRQILSTKLQLALMPQCCVRQVSWKDNFSLQNDKYSYSAAHSLVPKWKIHGKSIWQLAQTFWVMRTVLECNYRANWC